MRKLTFYFQLQDLWGIIFLECAFLNSGTAHFSDVQAFHLLILGIFYLTTRILTGYSKYFQLAIIVGLVLFLLVEALAGFGQIYGFYQPCHPTLRMSGTFQNPESYSGFLACMLPLPLSLALRANNAPGKRYYIIPAVSGICTFLVISLLPASMSPCCWLAAGVGSCIVIIHHFRTFRNYKILLRRFPKRVVFFTLIFLILLPPSSYLMYDSLQNPEEDRSSLWEESIGLIGRSPIYGHGLGSFHHLIDKDRLYTDIISPVSISESAPIPYDTTFCFNEYLRIAVDNGIPALLFFILLVVTALYNAWRNQQAGFTGCILAFMVFAYLSDIYDILSLSMTFTVVLALCGRKLSLLQPRSNKHGTHFSILSQ